MLNKINEIITLSEKRIGFLHNVDNKGFYEGYKTYIRGIEEELEETINEIKPNNSVYLEDELGDIFWDYICLLHSLEEDKLINKQKVFERCYKKFSERVGKDGKSGGDWDTIKKKQKQELKKESENN